MNDLKLPQKVQNNNPFTTEVMTVLYKIQLILEADAETALNGYDNFSNYYINSNGLEDSETEIMLRFIPQFKIIVLARVCVEKRRQGTVTKIINLLKTIPGYNHIEAESVLTEEMKVLCLKNGFVQQSMDNVRISNFAPLNYDLFY